MPNDTWKNILRHDVQAAVKPFRGIPQTTDVREQIDAAVRKAWTSFVVMAMDEVHAVLKDEAARNARAYPQGGKDVIEIVGGPQPEESPPEVVN